MPPFRTLGIRARFQRSDAMTTFIPTIEDMQALADLQKIVANLRAYLGLALVASTLPSFPHGATGFAITPSSPSSDAEAEAQGERKDQEALSPILIKEAADQQGEVALVEPSVDNAALMANKRAMEQVVTASSPPSPDAEAEAQGGGGKGDDAIGQTLAELPLPLPQAAVGNTPERRNSPASTRAKQEPNRTRDRMFMG
ncbi:hypothetical protein GUJ93_ZPchr0013g34733 [Zizania palustris]|uniref:Uncharacterized protein n=1 Tax=Zizania palustris TaxID=103762 RepID=A0A8J6C0B2_ZIZPA|nr:hypothetical protein GUJ93_ZPchr0013g34733 [Zizania palustris]